MARGLKTWQNPDAYRKALLGFSNTYSNTASDLSQLIDHQDQNAAHSLSHKLKGVAGNLSVMDVYEVSSKINDALKEEKMSDAREMIDPLAKVIAVVIESIRQLEDKGEIEEKSREKFDFSRVLKLIREMLEAFEQFNPDAVEPHLKELKSYLSEQQVAPIAKRIDEFHFIGAKEETIKLAKELGIDVEA